MLRSLLLAVVTLLSASCVMDTLEDEDVGLAAQELCMSCGGNGLNKRWAWYWDGTLNPSSLGKYGLWNGDHSINPLCAWWSGSQCMATDAWKNWLSDFGNGDATHTKAGNFEYIVKVAACQGQSVKANGVVYYGQFCLAPEALTNRWGAKQKQIITAGMIALLNLNDGVPICLATEDRNECCANDYCVEESITFGNVFQGAEVAAVAGGKKDGIYFAPTQNKRLCGVNAYEACEVALQTWNRADDHCSFSRPEPSQRHALNCDGWDYPVSVHLPSNLLPQMDYSRPRVERRLFY